MAPTFPRPYGAPAPRRPLAAGLPTSREFEGEPVIHTVPVRRYDVMYLDGLGNIEETNFRAPAIESFEASCGAFAHGTLIGSDMGNVPVEDLIPGQTINTRDNGPQTIRWIGSMTLVPSTNDPRVAAAKLTRITEGSIGLGRPERHLVLGPHARILRRNAACLSLFGTEAAFAPANAFTDGVSIIEVNPVSSVRVFHIMLDGQQIITAGGIETESYPPGRRDTSGVPTALTSAFLELFPHIDDFAGFGPMRVPRLSADDIRSLESA